MDYNKVITTYLKMRDKRAADSKVFKEADRAILEKMERLEHVLLKHIKDNGLKNIKGQSGTATRLVKTRYWASDKESFLEFVKENEAFGIMDQRITQSAMKQFLKDYPDLKPPINTDSKYAIVVRRSST